MAAYTLTVSPMTKILSTTTVDTWQILPGVLRVEVYNKSGSTELSVVAGEDTASLADPTAEGDGVDCAQTGGYVIIDIPTGINGGVLKVLGNGNKYQLRTIR